MNDLQKCLLDLLKAFIEVCDKNNLTYYLIAGSALGAVRHNGFIPWDDDIDVAMPRKDFDKYIELQKEYEGTRFFIQTYKTDPKYIYNYAKLRDNNTTYIENFYATTQMNHGVWLDIFPLDGASLKEEPSINFAKRIRHDWNQMKLCYLFALRRKFSKRTFFLDLAMNIASLPFWFLNINHYRNKRLDKELKSIPYEEATMVGDLCGLYYKKEVMNKNVFLEGTYVKFEDIEVRVPKDYDRYLSNLYGDYMKLPPEEKRVGHHYDKGFSLTTPWKEYIYKNKR